jgi:hypothetical protein
LYQLEAYHTSLSTQSSTAQEIHLPVHNSRGPSARPNSALDPLRD